MNDWLNFYWERRARSGIPEAVLGTGKTAEQVLAIARAAVSRNARLLFTRLSDEQRETLRRAELPGVEVHNDSATASTGRLEANSDLSGRIGVVAAGSSDLSVAREAERTLWFHGADEVPFVMDVGVAGLWRLMARIEELRALKVIVAVAGMEGALFSVLAGQVPGLVIAVPTSVGYGVSADGRAALHSALASCSPGVVAVNVDNGFGGAIAAIKAVASS